MTGLVRLALALVPLGIYFFLLAAWQGGKRPKLVAGPVDFLLIAIGLGNLVVFGPVGQFIVASVFRSESEWAWLSVASLVALMALFLAPRTARRLVVYHVSADDLRRAVGDSLKVYGTFEASVAGFEDRMAGRGVTMEVGKRLQFGVVEGYGHQAEELIATLGPALRIRLREVKSMPSLLATIWTALGCLAVLVPISAALLSRAEVRAAARTLFHRLRGG